MLGGRLHVLKVELLFTLLQALLFFFCFSETPLLPLGESRKFSASFQALLYWKGSE